MFWVFLLFEVLGWGEYTYGEIKTFVEINRMNKTLPQYLDSPLQYNFTIIYLCKSKWTMNSSSTYFRNVTLQLVKLYCLKPFKLWQTGGFSMTHPSLSQTVKLLLLSFLSSLLFSFFEMYFFSFLRFTSILSFQTNPGLSFPPNLILMWNEFTVRGPGFASLYSLYSFHVSKIKEKKLNVEEKYTPKNYR